ncbi:MAG: DNA mismatch repair endonuclease MutL [Anaerolineales bacterium]
MPIRILPDEVSSAIAAGEVIERPASVVRELVENSLDAGASEVSIRVEGGGRGLIEVIDDGEGIPTDEVILAVARYATSKLKNAQDLQSIQTLGFRGEALASIGAVTRLEIETRSQDEPIGTRLRVEGGKVGTPSSIGISPGTMVRVKDLFFNVPARREFLKSERTERQKISEFVSRYAMAYAQIQFSLELEGKQRFQSTGSGNIRETLAKVFGSEKAASFLQIKTMENSRINIHGYVSPPEVNRGTRRELTFFVNGRWVRDASLNAAVLQAYHGLLMVGRFPMAVIFLEISPSDVDVNVHPGKTEVRFREPDQIFSVLQRAVRAALIGQSPVPGVEFGGRWGSQSDQKINVNPDWLLSNDPTVQEMESRARLQPALAGSTVPLLRAVGQIGASYLVAEGPDGLYLVDQHAAHERILFDEMMLAHEDGKIESQRLLEPLTVEFQPGSSTVVDENMSILGELGFEIEPFGENVFRLRAVPALLGIRDPERVLRSAVDDFEEDEAPLKDEHEARIAARVCKRAAIKSGQVLSLEEQQKLLRDLEQCSVPRSCPHGRPTMIHLSVDALERQFGRRG